jgi:hypothetical protein
LKNTFFKSLPTSEEILNLIKILASIEVNDNSGCVFISLKESEEMGEAYTNKILGQYQSDYDVFKDIFLEIKEELISTSINLHRLLFSESLNQESFIVQYQLFFNYIIRVYRLLELVKPDYVISITHNTKVQKLYETAKGFWITDQGKRLRIFNKNFGKRSDEFHDYVSKLLVRCGFDVLPEIRKYEKIIFDFLISKEGKSYFCEIKIRNIDLFLDTFMTIEMWLHYKKTYGI